MSSNRELAAIAGLKPSSRNLLINSRFNVNQRLFAGGALAAGAYGYDRWGAYNGGANYSVSSGVITLASGIICQTIEAPSLAGLPVTVSVDGPTAALTVTLGNGTGADSVQGVISAGSGRKSVTLTVPATITADLKVRIAGTSASFSKPKLELGILPTPWIREDQATEFFKCTWYYQDWGTAFNLFSSSDGANGNTKPIPQMRINPAITQSTASGSGAMWIAISGRLLAQQGAHSTLANTQVLKLDAELACTD